MSEESKKKPAVEKKEAKPTYGVAELAKELGIEPASARVALRNNEIAKDGKTYSWATKGEMMKVVSQLRKNKKEKADA